MRRIRISREIPKRYTAILMVAVSGIAMGLGRNAAAQTTELSTNTNAVTPKVVPMQRTPSEVLLVYNSASSTSTAIANYYAAQRGVTNVLAVSCIDSALNDTNETISFSNYKTKIQTPISNYLSSHSGINFIVLTKGIPIRIDGASTGSEDQGQSPQDYQPSLDSYLAALGYSTANGDVQATIVGSGAQGVAWINKYYNSNAPFTHAAFGGYLVTRLDGYTQSDAMALVDGATAATQNPLTGSILLDVDINQGLGDKTTMPPATPSTNVTFEETYDHGNADMLHAADILEASGITTDLAITSTFVGNQSNLLGYFSWGSNDSDYDSNAYESLSFAPGSIGNTIVSTSMRTFLPTTGGQSLMADLIANGLTGAGGNVGEPTLNGVVGYTFTISHYEAGYTLAESYYAGTPYLGWEETVVGDPLLAPYYGAMPPVTPTQASNFSGSAGGLKTEDNSEGDLDVGYITNGSYAYYDSINLAGMNTFRVRVASAGLGGNIGVHLDSATGTLIGTCAVPVTGDWQTWTTVTCGLTGASGTHNVYLVFTGSGSSGLFNVEWFAFLPSIEASSYNSLSGGEQMETSSEGGQDMGYILSGGYAVYNNINLAGKTYFAARVASAGSGGNIEVHLDSPSGTLLGTCTVPVTGDWQTWATETCSLSGASGTHNVYLVFTGSSGNYLFNLEWFAFN